ncbi:hypothetical protein AADR41_13260 [Streptomyces sp. CLV115]|uniref:hypothetical protein n=1 Tax=Streptomyces sp. CLV115 TaxID=3138502 RepID=UPI00313BD365
MRPFLTVSTHTAAATGPDRLTITHDGVIVHQGLHTLARPEAAEPRVTTAVGPAGTIGWAAVDQPTSPSGLRRFLVVSWAEAQLRFCPWKPLSFRSWPLSFCWSGVGSASV